MTIDMNLITEIISIIRAFIFTFAFALIVADITELHKMNSFRCVILSNSLYLMAAVIADCFLERIISVINTAQQLM